MSIAPVADTWWHFICVTGALLLWSWFPVSRSEAQQGIYITTIGSKNETMREQPGEIPIGNAPVYI